MDKDYLFTNQTVLEYNSYGLLSICYVKMSKRVNNKYVMVSRNNSLYITCCYFSRCYGFRRVSYEATINSHTLCACTNA